MRGDPNTLVRVSLSHWRTYPAPTRPSSLASPKSPKGESLPPTPRPRPHEQSRPHGPQDGIPRTPLLPGSVPLATSSRIFHAHPTFPQTRDPRNSPLVPLPRPAVRRHRAAPHEPCHTRRQTPPPVPEHADAHPPPNTLEHRPTPPPTSETRASSLLPLVHTLAEQRLSAPSASKCRRAQSVLTGHSSHPAPVR